MLFVLRFTRAVFIGVAVVLFGGAAVWEDLLAGLLLVFALNLTDAIAEERERARAEAKRARSREIAGEVAARLRGAL